VEAFVNCGAKNEESPVNNHNPNPKLFRFCSNIPHFGSC